jgi:hypothetical protein
MLIMLFEPIMKIIILTPIMLLTLFVFSDSLLVGTYFYRGTKLKNKQDNNKQRRIKR